VTVTTSGHWAVSNHRVCAHYAAPTKQFRVIIEKIRIYAWSGSPGWVQVSSAAVCAGNTSVRQFRKRYSNVVLSQRYPRFFYARLFDRFTVDSCNSRHLLRLTLLRNTAVPLLLLRSFSVFQSVFFVNLYFPFRSFHICPRTMSTINVRGSALENSRIRHSPWSVRVGKWCLLSLRGRFRIGKLTGRFIYVTYDVTAGAKVSPSTHVAFWALRSLIRRLMTINQTVHSWVKLMSLREVLDAPCDDNWWMINWHIRGLVLLPRGYGK